MVNIERWDGSSQGLNNNNNNNNNTANKLIGDDKLKIIVVKVVS